MKKNEYIKIVKFSSFFIKKYWYARYINYFNPLKFHPANLENYLSLKKKKYFFFFLKTLKYFTNSFFDYFILQNYNQKKTSYDTIVFSNIINEQKKYSIKNDYYFGGISNKIINSLVVYRNFTKDNSQIIKKKFLDKNVIILNKKNFILNELKYILYFIIIYFKIKIDYINQKDNKKRIFLKEASSFTNVASCLTNLRTLDQISKIIRKYNPKKVIITYEGHSWEKIVINYIKKNCFGIKIVGYQFSFLKKEDSLLLMNLPKFFYPDEILTVGNLNFDLLRKSQLYKNCHIDILGSPKFSKPKKIKKFIKACLVLTGLNRIDFYNFFYFTRKLAITFADYKFIFRMHPQSVMSNYFSNKIALPKNMIISKNSINHDISKSFFAIHGSSTSIFTCLSKGMWPLYYDYSNINTNILHSLNLKNTKIKKVEDFNKIIKQKYFFNNNYYLINKYFKDYYSSLNFNLSIFK